MMVLGGCDVKRGLCFSDTYVLDLRRLAWERIEGEEDIMGQREELGIGRIGSKVYVFGGEIQKNIGLVVMNITLGCQGMKCGKHGFCRNQVCMCHQGYFGDECDIKIKCKRDCLYRGVCLSTGKCKCYAGFEGDLCELFIPCPQNCTDETQGTCQSDGQCQCKNGFSGTACETLAQNIEQPIIYCPNNCSGHGVCNEVMAACRCFKNYYGEDCSLKNPPLRLQSDLNKPKPKLKLSSNNTNANNSTNSTNSTSSSDNNTSKSVQVQNSRMENPIRYSSIEQLQSNEQIKTNSSNNKTNQNVSNSSEPAIHEQRPGMYHQLSEKQQNYLNQSQAHQDYKFDSLYECFGQCSYNGICIDKKCYCKQGIAGEYCEIFDVSQLQGKPIELYIILAIVSLGVGYTTEIILGYYIARYINKKLEQTGDSEEDEAQEEGDENES